MPSAIKTAEKYGDDLQVIFVECQGTSPKGTERFTYKRKWMGTSAMWTSERPFTTGAKGLPNFALLSADGELLMKGHPGSMHSKMTKAIEAEIAAAKKGPKDAPKALKAAHKAFAKGKIAKALAVAAKVTAAGGDDASSAESATKTFRKAIDSKLDRVDWMLKHGYLLEAESLSESLQKALKDLEAYQERVAGFVATFTSPEMKDELKAAKGLGKLQAAMEEDGLDDKLKKKLKKFTVKNSDARIAARAEHLLSVFK